METEIQGFDWDVSWEAVNRQDVIYIDSPGEQQVYLTKSDLQTMIQALED